MMGTLMELSIVIPARNEARNIGRTLEAVCSWLSHKPWQSEVIVVANSSTDGTADIARGYAGRCPGLAVIDEPRRGKGYAVQTGMRAATGRIRMFMDADHSTTIDHYDLFAPHVAQGCDVVIGSVAVRGASVDGQGKEPLWRVLFGKLGNKWIQLFGIWGIQDTQRGFKIFSQRAAEAIFPRLTIFGWGFDVEVLAIARARGLCIKELPVTHWRNAPDSKVNIWSYPQVLMQTLKVFRNRIIGRYKK